MRERGGVCLFVGAVCCVWVHKADKESVMLVSLLG